MTIVIRVRVSLSHRAGRGYRIRVRVRARISFRMPSGGYPRFGVDVPVVVDVLMAVVVLLTVGERRVYSQWWVYVNTLNGGCT